MFDAKDMHKRLIATVAALLGALLGALLVPNARAETLFGVYAGAGTWHQDSEGHIQSNGTQVDTKQDMGLGDDNGTVLFVAIEHPVPIVPNLRVQHAEVGMNGGIEIERDVVLDGVTFRPPGSVETTFDLEMTDAIAYYRLLDSALSLDLGLAARKLEGSASIAGGVYRAEVEFDGTLPMLYAAAEWDLLSGFWMAANAMGATYKGDEFLDFSAMLGWNSDLGLGVEFGYRYVRLNLDELGDVEDAKLIVDGPFAALNYRF